VLNPLTRRSTTYDSGSAAPDGIDEHRMNRAPQCLRAIDHTLDVEQDLFILEEPFKQLLHTAHEAKMLSRLTLDFDRATFVPQRFSFPKKGFANPVLKQNRARPAVLTINNQLKLGLHRKIS
jgi:hypothetical protein